MSSYTLWRERSDPAAGFTVCAMFTSDYQTRAERLAASLDAVGLSYAIFEAPSVHRSISDKGGDDLTYAKPAFIAHALRLLGRPVVYVDCDFVFRAKPLLFDALTQEGVDFAIYNWLADSDNDAWRPVPGQPIGQPRYWRFFFRMNAVSQDQLVCSGGVQFWRDTPVAFDLLRDWEAALVAFPQAPDDHCLDYAFNRGASARAAQVRWLPKDHVRIGFWVHVQPVIDHADLPGQGGGGLALERVDKTKLSPRPDGDMSFPRDAIIDAQDKILLLPGPDGRHVPSGSLSRPLYISVDGIDPFRPVRRPV